MSWSRLPEDKDAVLLGIDPGLHITGYGILLRNRDGKIKLLEGGIIRTDEHKDMAERLKKIHLSLSRLLAEFKPQLVILEELYSHYKHPVTAIKMAHARGMVLLAAQEQNINVVEYSAKRIKKSITGNGNASKEQVQHTVKQMLNIKTPTGPLDVTDAMALCLGHIYMEQHRI